MKDVQEIVDGKLKRKSVDYLGEYQRFVLKKKAFDQQFSHIYVSRLTVLQEYVKIHVRKETKAPILPKIIDLKEGDHCVIIGTAFKVLAIKPNILDEFVADEATTSLEIQRHKKLASEKDILLLEDESGRVQLRGNNIDVQSLVTGVIIGVEGEMQSDGEGFLVKQIYTPEIPLQQQPSAVSCM